MIEMISNVLGIIVGILTLAALYKTYRGHDDKRK